MAVRSIFGRFAALFLHERVAGLLRLFAALSIVAALCVLGITGIALHNSVQDEILRQAEADAQRAGQAIFRQERELLVDTHADGTAHLGVNPESARSLHERMTNYLLPASIDRLTVFSPGADILYSTETRLIGRKEAGNPRLSAVLREGLASSEALNADGQARASVVVAYMPIVENGRIIGALQLDVDVAAGSHGVSRVVGSVLGKLLLSLALVFGGLYFLMRKSVNRLKRTEAEMEKLAATDPLTGVANRRYLLARAGAEYSSVRRSLSGALVFNEIGFIMVDIDFFKNVNDSFGHLVGDDVLRKVAARIKHCLREYDVVGRFGGEEFLVMLPRTDLAGARTVAQRVHAAIRDHAVVTEAGALSVTASLGVASSGEAGIEVSEAIKRADECLYRAKRAGRDRVVVFEPEAEQADQAAPAGAREFTAAAA